MYQTCSAYFSVMKWLYPAFTKKKMPTLRFSSYVRSMHASSRFICWNILCQSQNVMIQEQDNVQTRSSKHSFSLCKDHLCLGKRNTEDYIKLFKVLGNKIWLQYQGLNIHNTTALKIQLPIHNSERSLVNRITACFAFFFSFERKGLYVIPLICSCNFIIFLI